MPNKKSAVPTPKTITLKTPSPNSVLVRALAEKLKGWMEEDLPFLGVINGDVKIVEDSARSITCQFSSNACHYVLDIIDFEDDDIRLGGWCTVHDGLIWIVPIPIVKYGFDDEGCPFCKETWQKLLLTILKVEEKVAGEKIEALHQHQYELRQHKSKAVPA